MARKARKRQVEAIEQAAQLINNQLRNEGAVADALEASSRMVRHVAVYHPGTIDHDSGIETAEDLQEIASRYRDAAAARATTGATSAAYRSGWDRAFGRN